MVAPYTASAPARSRMPGYACASRASDTANIAAAPSPWTARAASSITMLPESAHTSDEAVNTTRPTTKTRLRPSRSASEPQVRTTVASASV